MRILYLCTRLPYAPNRGDRSTTLGIVGEMSKQHEVSLISFVDGSEPKDARERVRALCERVEIVALPRWVSWLSAMRGVFSRIPSQVSYYRSRAMTEMLDRVLAETRYDAIVVQMSRLAPFVERLSHPCKVLFLADSQGMFYRRSRSYWPWWLRIPMAYEARRAEDYELAAVRHFREAWVVSALDRDDLRARGCANVESVGHGIDEAFFAAQPCQDGAPSLVLLGNFSVPHNVDAARYLVLEIFPRVRREIAGATLTLVGADPLPAIVRFGSEPGVVVTGEVADVVPFLERSQLMVAPLRYSSGVQNKVLAGMAASLPVVTAPHVAAPIGELAESGLAVAGSTEEYVREICRLLRHPEERRARGARGREYVRRHFSWGNLVRRLEALASGAAGPR